MSKRPAVAPLRAPSGCRTTYIHKYFDKYRYLYMYIDIYIYIWPLGIREYFSDVYWSPSLKVRYVLLSSLSRSPYRSALRRYTRQKPSISPLYRKKSKIKKKKSLCLLPSVISLMASQKKKFRHENVYWLGVGTQKNLSSMSPRPLQQFKTISVFMAVNMITRDAFGDVVVSYSLVRTRLNCNYMIKVHFKSLIRFKKLLYILLESIILNLSTS